MQWHQNKPIVGLSWLIWALFASYTKEDLYQGFLVFHTSIFSKTQEELEAARHGRSANLKIWQRNFFCTLIRRFPRASTLHCGRGPRSSPHVRKSVPRRRRSTKTRQYSTCLVLGIIKVLHYIVKTVHLTKVKKKQAFRPSSTSPTLSLQCSLKTSPSLSIWDTCPWRGVSSSQLPFSWQGKRGYFSLDWSNYVPSLRFVKTWLITALVNFHAMRGDMADEARDSISSEEVKALASNLKNVEVKSFQQHLTLEKKLSSRWQLVTGATWCLLWSEGTLSLPTRSLQYRCRRLFDHSLKKTDFETVQRSQSQPSRLAQVPTSPLPPDPPPLYEEVLVQYMHIWLQFSYVFLTLGQIGNPI